jgi:hypothetical protein
MRERTIDDIIRRDFDSLPLPPRTEWLPVVHQRRRLQALAAIPVIAVALVLAFVIAHQIVSYRAAQLERSNVGAAASAMTSPGATLDPAGVGGARSAIIARIRALSGEVLSVQRIEAKLMRRSDFEHVQPSGSAQYDGNRWIWTVAVAGEIRPQFAHGATFPWGVYLIDAQSGDVLGLLAGSGSWPAYFDALPDAAGASSVGPGTAAPSRPPSCTDTPPGRPCVIPLPNVYLDPSSGYDLVVPEYFRKVGEVIATLPVSGLIYRARYTVRPSDEDLAALASYGSLPPWDFVVELYERRATTSANQARLDGCAEECVVTQTTIRQQPTLAATWNAGGLQFRAYYIDRGNELLVLKYATGPEQTRPAKVNESDLQRIIETIGLV